MVPRARDNGTSSGQFGRMRTRSVPLQTTWVLQPQRATTWVPTGNVLFLLWITLQKQKQIEKQQSAVHSCLTSNFFFYQIHMGWQKQQMVFSFLGNFTKLIYSNCFERLNSEPKNTSNHPFSIWFTMFCNWKHVQDCFCKHSKSKKTHVCASSLLCHLSSDHHITFFHANPTEGPGERSMWHVKFLKTNL